MDYSAMHGYHGSTQSKFELNQEFTMRMDSISSTLDRWDQLLDRSVLSGRINSRNFAEISKLIERYCADGTMDSVIESSVMSDQLDGKKRQFNSQLLSSLKSVKENYNPQTHSSKVLQLNKIALECLSIEPNTDFAKTLDIAVKELQAKVNASTLTSTPVLSATTSEIPAPSQLDIASYVEVINTWSPNPRLDEKNIKEYIQRGGVLQILEEGKKISLNPNHLFITGCTSGVNRSQTMRAFLLQNGCKVEAPLAGGDSGMNPDCDYPCFSGLYHYDAEKILFKEACGTKKILQLGAKELENIDVSDVAFHKSFFEKYFDSLDGSKPTHFICFSCSGPSVLLRLLSKKGNLNNFTITFIPWGDEIAHPTNKSIESLSKEAYQAYLNKIQNSFQFNS